MERDRYRIYVDRYIFVVPFIFRTYILRKQERISLVRPEVECQTTILTNTARTLKKIHIYLKGLISNLQNLTIRAHYHDLQNGQRQEKHIIVQHPEVRGAQKIFCFSLKYIMRKNPERMILKHVYFIAG